MKSCYFVARERPAPSVAEKSKTSSGQKREKGLGLQMKAYSNFCQIGGKAASPQLRGEKARKKVAGRDRERKNRHRRRGGGVQVWHLNRQYHRRHSIQAMVEGEHLRPRKAQNERCKPQPANHLLGLRQLPQKSATELFCKRKKKPASGENAWCLKGCC